MRDFSHGSKCHEQGHLILEVLLVGRECGEHLSGSLGVANIGNFLIAGCSLDVVNNGREIVLAHFKPTEVPVFFLVVVWIQSRVAKTVGVTTRVAHPDVIASAGSDECRCDLRVVNDPAVG